MQIKLRDKTYEVGGVLPLTIKDWKELDGKGVTIESLNDKTLPALVKITKMATMLLHVINKVDATVTESFMDTLTPDEVLGAAASLTETKIDRPS